MLSGEIRDVFMIGISLILTAIVLSTSIAFIGVGNSLVESRNNEVYAQNSVANYREYNKYNGGEVLFGEDVVAAIRDYYNSGIQIKVDNYNGIYNVDKYLVRDNPELINIERLQEEFPTNRRYSAVLVYGGADLATVDRNYERPSSFGTNVTGIVFFHEGVR